VEGKLFAATTLKGKVGKAMSTVVIQEMLLTYDLDHL
jgi:hypothetical protein